MVAPVKKLPGCNDLHAKKRKIPQIVRQQDCICIHCGLEKRAILVIRINDCRDKFGHNLLANIKYERKQRIGLRGKAT